MNALRAAYISESSPEDKHAWSGTVHYVYEALKKSGFELIPLGPARPGIIRLVFGIINKISLFVFGKRFNYRHNPVYSRAFGKIFTGRLNSVVADFVIVCGNTECGAWTETRLPVVYILDRTIAGAMNYHAILSDLWKFSAKESINTDKRAMRNATHIFFSSDWAASHAIESYGVSPVNISVIPFGANLDEIPLREKVLHKKEMTACRLLFIGADWYNKGADIALKTLKILLQKKINATLTVIGSTPPAGVSNEKLNVIPFIDKNSPEGFEQLGELFLSHHFFILPTRFDCTPIVICEAGAYALPCLVADSGGVSGHLKHGVNGFLMPYEDKGQTYAKKIIELISDEKLYESLRTSTREYFESCLNWQTWGKTFNKTCENILRGRTEPASKIQTNDH